ncbi:MBOAT family O-acyltransferase [Sinanaerobacter chloroacetimidivorans]|jgi:alginate O-acetyltransferase complex protein AlgI|uniref:MBOAT family protein n=1 Tax=Sinanaerobacter chloroacetimidivorans TaxID=2818044 RepID=A0A8J7VX93_9FIRM|nr:MBOAT family protein [Sinanaerobacter chloroacetimidivorans]MBR0596747.1 MBOAT family protein [Sinanaerobacter chloroacetimidivorans]
MLFSSLIFISCFLPAVLAVYYTLLRNRRKAQNVFLLLASLGFYAWGEPWFVLILVGSIIGNWIFGLWIDRSRENKMRCRWIITFMAIFNLSIIFVFKYLMFTLNNINKLFGTELPIPVIMLPIGISFFTFQAISYVLDVYRGHGQAQKNPLNVGLYISFFPQLVAGPIVRYETIAKQIMNRKETLEGFSQGVCRFLFGFGKKVLLANNFAIIADKAFSLPGDELSVSFAWLGAIAYTLQIYYDFSGYSDMAIGLGKMFGFEFLENFNYPYISKSISEFWRRWHISLGTWFRDYVYFPMGGSRVSSKWRMIFNLLVVWGLTGLWHGANWTFICWGLMYFVLIAAEKSFHFDSLGEGHIGAAILKRVYTLFMVIVGWVLFRAATIGNAFAYLSSMLLLSGNRFMDVNTAVYLAENKYFLIFGILFSMPIYHVLIKWAEARVHSGNRLVSGIINTVYPLGLMVLFLVALSYLVKGSYNPFIYFNF